MPTVPKNNFCSDEAIPSNLLSLCPSKKYLRKYVNLFPQTSVNICGNSKIYLRKYVCVFPQINSRNRGILVNGDFSPLFTSISICGSKMIERFFVWISFTITILSNHNKNDSVEFGRCPVYNPSPSCSCPLCKRILRYRAVHQNR